MSISFVNDQPAHRSSQALADQPIPMVRLNSHGEAFQAQLLDAVARLASTGGFTLGEEVANFETEFAAFCETSFAVGVSSGTEALVLALRALEIGPGHEVIIPANSFIATAEAVSLVGAKPSLVDVDPKTHLLSADAVSAAITSKTRCVIPVHLMGSTVDLDPILEVARAAGLRVIEDACQAHGARYKSQRVGSIGDLGCFSFYPTKNLGGWGDGGAVVTSDATLADRVRLLRSHGENQRYFHRVCGTTARLDAIQAAVLRLKLARLETWNGQRRELGRTLQNSLRGCGVQMPEKSGSEADHVFHQFVIRVSDREALRSHLESRGIASAIHYPVPIHRTEAYEYLGLGQGSLPATERLANEICTLPLFPGMTHGELRRVASAVHEFAALRTA